MLRMKSMIVAIFLLGLVPFSAHAKSLISLLPALLNEHEQIKAAEARRDESRYLILSTKGGRYPSVDLNADVGREWVNTVQDVNTSENRNKESLRITQLLTDFGSTESSINRAETIFVKSKVELEASRQDVLLKGVLAYLEVIKAREKLVYAKKSEANIVKQTGMEESLVEHGAGLSSDILQIKSQLARARALRVSVEGELFVAENRYRAVFDNTLSEEDREAFSMPVPPLDKMPDSLENALQYAAQHNPKVLADKLNVSIAEHEMKFSRTRFFPKLNLYAEGTRRQDDMGVLGIRKEASVGAEINYNLFNGFTDQSSMRMAVSKRVEMQSVLRENTKLIEEVTRNAWQNYLTSKEKHKYLQNQTAIVGEFLKLARKERKLGTRSLLDVLSGEVEYVNAVSQSVAAEIETIEAVYKIFHAMGDLTIDIF